MYIYIYIYIYIFVHIYICIFIYLSIYLTIYIYISIYLSYGGKRGTSSSASEAVRRSTSSAPCFPCPPKMFLYNYIYLSIYVCPSIHLSIYVSIYLRMSLPSHYIDAQLLSRFTAAVRRSTSSTACAPCKLNCKLKSFLQT